MNGFIFASGVNDPRWGHGTDSTNVFRPGAEAFKKIHGIRQDIFYFDYREKDAVLREKIVNKLKTVPCSDGKGLEVVAYFGHGIPHAINSAGFHAKKGSAIITDDVRKLADAIASKCKQKVKVILYACLAGTLPTSFAGVLATALKPKEATVFGRTKSGHAFGNPYYTKFEGGHTGRFVIPPGDPLWNAWMKEIMAGNSRDPKKHPLWAKFPFMSEQEIRASLAPAVAAGGSK